MSNYHVQAKCYQSEASPLMLTVKDIRLPKDGEYDYDWTILDDSLNGDDFNILLDVDEEEFEDLGICVSGLGFCFVTPILEVEEEILEKTVCWIGKIPFLSVGDHKMACMTFFEEYDSISCEEHLDDYDSYQEEKERILKDFERYLMFSA